ncbi:MAG TPA: amidophosphoribosyltransferase, partial [Campylobacterales bacterium]|nr:amidophosphoribosyltransferase [Campylobacterales bacterium]
VVIDDSIVRGTTSKQIVRMLRDAGAKEVHMRVSSPPTTDPCFYGIDTPDKSHLINASKSVDEVRKFIGADSLAYLTIESLLASCGDDKNSYCLSCFDGKYII